MPDPLISSATRRNWERLHVADTDSRLTSRANKRLSDKNILPAEYALTPAAGQWCLELSALLRRNGWDIGCAMYSLCLNLLHAASMDTPAHLHTAFCGLPEYAPIEPLLHMTLPSGEQDLLGLAYQTLLSEGARNQKGAYYTPPCVTADMTDGLHRFSGRCLDPCCGSGAFLTALINRGIPSESIFGCDNDPVAVMLARVNLLFACRGGIIPQVICADFLHDALPFPPTFDLIITNPPWGAMGKDESFSSFLYAGCRQLNECGRLRFLLPDSFLNIRTHRAVRRYLLENACITRIRLYGEMFSGVTTGCLCIDARRGKSSEISVSGRDIALRLSAAELLADDDCIFSLLDNTDRSIFQKVRTRGTRTLAGSTWALGIVTGSNRQHLKEVPCEGDEPIYTGREVLPYRLSPPRYYIRYDRTAFQQSAKEEYYRAAEKLVYKFISKRPVFALDESGSLCLNSANILIPSVEGMTVRTVMALLNSRLYQYLYMKRFGDLKILKRNLQKLPLPALSAAENETIDAQVRAILGGSASDDALEEYLFRLFSLTPNEITRIYDITKGRNNS